MKILRLLLPWLAGLAVATVAAGWTSMHARQRIRELEQESALLQARTASLRSDVTRLEAMMRTQFVHWKDEWEQLAIDMSQEHVRGLLGNEHRFEYATGLIVVHYDYADAEGPASLRFDSRGRLREWTSPKLKPSAGHAPPPGTGAQPGPQPVQPAP